MRQCIFRAQGLHGIARREGQGRNIDTRDRSHCRIEREAGRFGIQVASLFADDLQSRDGLDRDFVLRRVGASYVHNRHATSG